MHVPSKMPTDTVNEEQIGKLVDTFYTSVRADELLGPVFATAIGNGWGPHLAKMRAFWCSLVLASGTYKGSPMMVHMMLPNIGRAHFDRWLQLWRRTLDEQFSRPVASVFLTKAEFMAEQLLRGIAIHHGETV